MDLPIVWSEVSLREVDAGDHCADKTRGASGVAHCSVAISVVKRGLSDIVASGCSAFAGALTQLSDRREAR